MENREIEVLKEVVGHLDAIGIAYMITGSIALHFYAIPRMTRDIDIVVEISESHIDALIKVFESDCYLDAEMIHAAIRNKSMFNFIHTAMAVKLDFIVRKSSPYRIKEFERRRKISYADTSFFIVSPEDLILSKLWWARDSLSETQLKDVRGIMGCLGDLDFDYMEHWAREMGIESLYKDITHG
ncbi:MAG: DUF6036 family nucleotidyltransferase [Candidatus Sumerlaeia bacterium]